MNEDMPELELDLNGEAFIATPLNATLYTFVGQSALAGGELVDNSSRNHIFLQTDDSHENPDGTHTTPGAYIFGEAVQRIGMVMLTMQFPATLYSREVHPSDEAAYQVYIDQQPGADDIEDYMPEDWK